MFATRPSAIGSLVAGRGAALVSLIRGYSFGGRTIDHALRDTARPSFFRRNVLPLSCAGVMKQISRRSAGCRVSEILTAWGAGRDR